MREDGATMTDNSLANVTVGYSSLIDRTDGIPAATALAGAELVVVVQTGTAAGEKDASGDEAAASKGAVASTDAPASTDALASTTQAAVSHAATSPEDRGARVVVLNSRGVAKSRN